MKLLFCFVASLLPFFTFGFTQDVAENQDPSRIRLRRGYYDTPPPYTPPTTIPHTSPPPHHTPPPYTHHPTRRTSEHPPMTTERPEGGYGGPFDRNCEGGRGRGCCGLSYVLRPVCDRTTTQEPPTRPPTLPPRGY